MIDMFWFCLHFPFLDSREAPYFGKYREEGGQRTNPFHEGYGYFLELHKIMKHCLYICSNITSMFNSSNYCSISKDFTPDYLPSFSLLLVYVTFKIKIHWK